MLQFLRFLMTSIEADPHLQLELATIFWAVVAVGFFVCMTWLWI